ncbi:MAG: acyl-phosphate glycerol 3-phosphate acyltransferase [Clostridiales bacterium]|uniref:glycerol-3-phosphate 1-O-acyltransferase PlsY n=1 Tax=Provencibacterium massiliense TaxID=1841868 RepID=UPI0009A871A0|nr:glycerol-3-phosphate 1-O-acyltransferase PlsY [Provencibacterium massiliense]PWM35283.1 MAG: acyl-phosphate glycerol 3-phosphate acyltransferase [Clostridiales bacterium]RGB63821.1 glycerol-3-phosphate 1-O-acyltransferase [Harryflintia acetispora]
MITILASAICLVEGYLLGSLNFSIMVSRLFKGEDIRNYGSKNAGMTNILRTYGKKYAVMVGVGDFCKGVCAVFIGRLIFSLMGVTLFDAGYAAGAAALLGHLFPLYFGFKGGKGVLTGLGVVLTLSPLSFAIIVLLELPLLYFTRIVSLASVTGAILYPIVTCVVHILQRRPFILDTVFSVALAGVVLYMHRANIKRLLSGTEYRFGQDKKKQ